MAEENSYGYGEVEDVAKETSGSGKYLNFKKGDKGRIIQIRIVSEPRYVLQHWVSDVSGKKSPIDCLGSEKCVYCNDETLPGNEDPRRKTAKWGWVVIDRDDEEVKIFTGPLQIARSIKDISQLPNKSTGKPTWGDPRTYDLQIERTEDPGSNYYKVNPVPDGRGEITEEETDKVNKAGYNLQAELGNSTKSENTGKYDVAKELETAPDLSDEPDGVDPHGAVDHEEVTSKEIDDMPF